MNPSTPQSAWNQVANRQRIIDAKAKAFRSLPIEEFRKLPYRPAPLSANAPIPGDELRIYETTVVVRDGTEVMARIYQPLELTKEHPLYFNIHGGGWTTGSPETEEEQNRMIAVEINAVVVSVDYRKAPEFPFPYALNDSYDVFKWALDNAESIGADPDQVIIGGGSAGANIATVVARMARDEGLQGIRGQILNIPVTCHPDHNPTQGTKTSYHENAHAPIVDAEMMRWFWKNYLPTGEADSRSSPLLETSLQDMPPALVQVAGRDPLRDEGIAYAKRLTDSGVNVTLKLYSGLPHAFHIYPELEATAEYIRAMIDWIKNLDGLGMTTTSTLDNGENSSSYSYEPGQLEP